MFNLDELRPNTRFAAITLSTACPWVKYTSGYRTWLDQAHAMAVNVAQKRDWLGQVYKREPQLQAWVDAHPEITDLEGIENGLYFTLMGLDKGTLDRFAHPARRAFDMEQPYDQWQDATVHVIESLPRLDRFLRGEGGLPIWHCQFHE